MGRKHASKKHEVAEDWCFVCKDGGSLRICDHKNCLKAYHPECVEREDSLLESEEKWKCDLHSCFKCCKAPKFYCMCCPSAVCGHCICDAEFAIVKGNKGLCNHNDCLELAFLLEEKKDTDSHGCKIDFSAPEYFYFYDYWKIIKEKERLTSKQVISAYNLLKKGEYCPSASNSYESDEGEEDFDESEDDSQIRKRKKFKGNLSLTKSKVKSSRKEFIGWGSKALLEFLASIGRDTSQELSDDVVTTIISEYCKENKLFDPERKRKVICDARLQALFGRKSVNKNSINKLLTAHLAENVDYSEEEFGRSSDYEDEDDSVACKRQPSSLKKSQEFRRSSENEDENHSAARKKQSSSIKKSHAKEAVVYVRRSCFASVVPKNIKLVYLRKSLVEELSKLPETFDAKLMGSFVRVRSDPNDHLQKSSHQLVQVTGIHRTSTNAEILLEVSNRVKGVPTCKLSDDDFSEEECEDLHQRVKNGLVNRPTVVELRQKARSLHEDIIKHWIEREMVLLRKRIDKANERGWRRQFYEDMAKLLKLQTPSEQSRLLNVIPEVISDVVEIQHDCEESTRKDEKEHIDSSPESAHRKTCKIPAWNLKTNRGSCHLKDSTDNTAIVTKGKTGTIAPSGGQHIVRSHDEASGSGVSRGRALKPSGGEATNSAADLDADGSNEMNQRGGENSKEVARGYGKALKTHNSSFQSSLENDGHKPALDDQTSEPKLVINGMQELGTSVKEILEKSVKEILEKSVKDMREELKDFKEEILVKLSS